MQPFVYQLALTVFYNASSTDARFSTTFFNSTISIADTASRGRGACFRARVLRLANAVEAEGARC